MPENANHNQQTQGNHIMKKTIITLTLLFLTTACNTFEGIGQDVKGAGEGLSKTATKVKEKL